MHLLGKLYLHVYLILRTSGRSNRLLRSICRDNVLSYLSTSHRYSVRLRHKNTSLRRARCRHGSRYRISLRSTSLKGSIVKFSPQMFTSDNAALISKLIDRNSSAHLTLSYRSMRRLLLLNHFPKTVHEARLVIRNEPQIRPLLSRI